MPVADVMLGLVVALIETYISLLIFHLLLTF